MREWLKELRRQQKRTQLDIASAMGVSKQYYSKLELDKTQQRMDLYSPKNCECFWNIKYGCNQTGIIERLGGIGVKEYQSKDENIGGFIANTDRNWRNSLYITCTVCKYVREKYCDDFLVSFDHKGIPTFLTAKDAGVIYGLIIDKSECIAEMSNVQFQELYNKLIMERKHTHSCFQGVLRCPLLDAAEVPLDDDAYIDRLLIPKSSK